MRKDRYKTRHFHKKSLTLVLALALSCVLLVCGVVGGTLAWLTAKSSEVENVFTTSDINIELKEHEYDPATGNLTDRETNIGVSNYKMIPGWTIPKDPWVTVKAGSEDCWVFIKVEETGGNVTVGGQTYTFNDFISYQIDPNNWTQLLDDDKNVVEGVYVYTVPHQSNITDSQIKVLGYKNGDEHIPNKVLVKDTVTKEMMNAIASANEPKLTFTAYAFQYWKDNINSFSAYEAWQKISTTSNS